MNDEQLPPPPKRGSFDKVPDAARAKRTSKTRDDDVSVEAARLGLGYLPDTVWAADLMPDARFDWLAYSELGNVMVGEYAGVGVIAFDAKTESAGARYAGGGHVDVRMIASCALTRLPVPVPYLRVMPKKRFPALRRYRTGDRRFDRLLEVRTRDRSFARALLDASMRTMLLGPDGRAGWLRRVRGRLAFELNGRWLPCSCPLVEPRALRERLLEPLIRFRAHIPDHVVT